jgi:TIR domain
MKTDAFISYASADLEFAEAIGEALEADKLNTRIDRSDVKFGRLLRNQIQSAIRDSRVLVLVWSGSALESRWVMTEIFTAFYLEHFIIPCVLDTSPLPQFLANSAYLDRQRDEDRIGQELCRAVRAAPIGANEVAPAMVSQTPGVQSLINSVAAGQYDVLAAVASDLRKAAEANRHVSDVLHMLQETAPLHPMVLTLAGYQCKNDYMIKHWNAIQAGRAPKDQLLDRGERYFF